jgi:hypothetical protein
MKKGNNIKEDSAFGPGMMFGVPGPGPSKDTEGIPSNKKKEKGKMIKKSFQKFESFLAEEKALNEIGDSTSKPFDWSTKMNVSKWLSENSIRAKDKQHSGSWEDRYHKADSPFRYEFTSDTTKTKYHVNIHGWFGRNLWLSFSGAKPKNWKAYHVMLGLAFGIDGVEGDPESNLNEHFRVMSTVVECALDFLQKAIDDDSIEIQEFHMNPKVDKEDQSGIDSRRGKLYLAYIKNSFRRLKSKKDYYISQSKDGFILKFGQVRMGVTGKIPDHVIAATYESHNKINNTEMKKHIPSYDDYLTESYATMLRSTAQILMSDPKIRSAAKTLVHEIIGKGVDYAVQRADDKLEIKKPSDRIDFSPSEDELELDNDSISTEEDAANFVSAYMAKSITKEEEERISEKTLKDIFKDIKDYIKRKIS